MNKELSHHVSLSLATTEDAISKQTFVVEEVIMMIV